MERGLSKYILPYSKLLSEEVFSSEKAPFPLPLALLGYIPIPNDILTGRQYVECTVFRDGYVRHLHYFLRLFTYPELTAWLRESRFKQVRGYDQEGHRLTLESQHLIVVAEKEEH